MRAAILACLALAACSEDRGQCVASHIEPMTITLIPFMPDGKTVTMMPVVHPERAVCDRWQLPEGKP